MWAAEHTCAQSGCLEPATNGSRYCPEHEAGDNDTKAYDRQRAQTDPVRKMYNRAPWKKLSAWLKRRNPQCQRIIGSLQCMNEATVVHHRISPYDRLDLFYVVRDGSESQVICLCERCHPGGQKGSPTWHEGIDYAKTNTEISVA